MALSAGTRLGPYEIVAPLGAGGMGEVYRATDTKLKRQVAIKVLPAAVTADPDRLARFQREAEVLASLNHPHIAAIYGLEDSGDVRALVMELVEGEDLAQRLARGPIAPVDALPIAKQVAEALEAAHDQGIIHRDLKPANIKLRPDGTVKIIDFGLARTSAGGARLSSAAEAAQSPTLISDVTHQGAILGTAAYMAPEQARGGAIDRRADIWSFGVVLYEMLTGERLFSEGGFADTLGAVMRKEIDFGRLPSSMSPELRKMLTRCLERDPKARLRDIGEARLALEAAHTPRATARPGQATDGRRTATPSVAVLPFRNLSADPENEYFADGITEDVIAHLSKVRSLKVISRTSVMTFKKSEQSLKEIGAALGARTLLEGSVRKAGNRVRIVAQLIDGDTDQHVWADTYDRDLTDIFAIQTDVALKIVAALRAELSADERDRIDRRPTDDVEAYQLYLRGRSHLFRFTTESLHQSLTFFERAIARDPGFALAHASMAHVYAEFGIEGTGLTAGEAFRRAKEAISKALELDNALGDAHGIAGLIRFALDFDWEGAEKELRLALELSPGSADVHDHYGWFCSSLQRHDDAIRAVRRAHELDPLAHQTDIATELLRARRFGEALAEAKRAVELAPTFPRCQSNLGWAQILTGHPAEGLAALERAVDLSPGGTLFLAQLGQACAMAGNSGRAREILARLQRLAADQYVSPYHFAYVLTGLGELDQAVDSLEHAFEQRTGAIYGIKGSFLFFGLRDHPRFRALLAKMNLL